MSRKSLVARSSALVLTFLMASPLALLASDEKAPAPRATAPLRQPAARPSGQSPPAAAAEAQALWQGLPPEEQQQRIQEFFDLVGPRLRAKIKDRVARPPQERLRPVSALKGTGIAGRGAAERITESRLLSAPGGGTEPPDPAPSLHDADGDGLGNALERQLAEGLMPVYHVSTGELPTTGFVSLQDTTTLVADQFLGQVPVAVHYRVTPLFEEIFNGIPHKFLQIDYLTIWNRDEGLEISSLCRTNTAILGGLIGVGLVSLVDGARAHDWDVERSAVLVGAPTASAGDPAAYRAYDYYLASHEGTFFNHSAFIFPAFPWPIGNHAQLWMSFSKHATYEGNPNFFPLMPGDIIAFTNGLLAELLLVGAIDDISYWIYVGIANSVFFSCIVEHFGEQGGALPTFQLNVGEKGQPINGSSWIADPDVSSKFEPLWIPG